MPHVEVESIVHAPWQQVAALYNDYGGWPRLFPRTIRGVRLVREEPGRTTVEVHHREGMVLNVLHHVSPHEVRLEEYKKRFDATFVNRFEAAGEGTRYRVVADVRLKWPWRLLAPFLHGYIRQQIVRYVLAPIKARAEHASTKGVKS